MAASPQSPVSRVVSGDSSVGQASAYSGRASRDASAVLPAAAAAVAAAAAAMEGVSRRSGEAPPRPSQQQQQRSLVRVVHAAGKSQSVGALVFIPPGPADAPGSLGRLWYHLNK